MNILELVANESTLSFEELARVSLRLLLAVVLGALIGWERERQRHWAGLRTHMLITLSSAAFMLFAVEYAATTESPGDALRVLQGITVGVGFIGAGTILKRPDRRRVHGLTTASGIWLAAATGVAVGAGSIFIALIATVFELIVAWGVGRIEEKMENQSE